MKYAKTLKMASSETAVLKSRPQRWSSPREIGEVFTNALLQLAPSATLVS